MQRNDRSYKDLKQKQKSAIADKTYKMHLKFYLENQRMPDATEMNDICKWSRPTGSAETLRSLNIGNDNRFIHSRFRREEKKRSS